MRTLGIIGGIAPGSTIEYYRPIIASYREQQPDGSYPSIVIDSIDLTRLLAIVGEHRLGELTVYLLEEVKRLARAGADFGLLASNTPHIVFEELSRASPIPLLSIVEAAADAAGELGRTRVGLLAGTELPLLLRDAGDGGPPLLDTTRIHVRRAVAQLLS